MTQPILDFKQAPPIWVPLRFLVTAPAFALLAAIIGLWEGPELFAARWSPATLAATHLATLGFAAMVMVGALTQILPVLVGAPVRRPRAVATFVHASLALGTLALAAGFLGTQPLALAAGMALLAAALAIFLAAMAASLARAAITNANAGMLWLAGAALGVTVTFGAWLAASRSLGVAAPPWLRDLHPAWGLLGWIGLLVVGVGYRVVPMFQLTPAYPRWMSWLLGLAVAAALTAWSVGVAGDVTPLAVIAQVLLAALYCAFAAITLRLQGQRRRRQPDVNLLFWRVGMICAIAALALWVSSSAWTPHPDGLAVALGVLAIPGATLSVINGMMYKIAPFLAWLHLQSRAGHGRRVPHLRQYLDEAWERRQFRLHVAALVLMLGAALAPEPLARAAALVFAASTLHLLVNVATIVRNYERHRATMQRDTEGHRFTGTGTATG